MIGDRLKEILDIKNIKQAELARSMKVSPGYISDVVNNKKIPGGEIFHSLKRTLKEQKNIDLNLDWLISGEGEMFISDPIESREYFKQITQDQLNPDNNPRITKIINAVLESEQSEEFLELAIEAKSGNKKAIKDLIIMLKGMEMMIK